MSRIGEGGGPLLGVESHDGEWDDADTPLQQVPAAPSQAALYAADSTLPKQNQPLPTSSNAKTKELSFLEDPINFLKQLIKRLTESKSTLKNPTDEEKEARLNSLVDKTLKQLDADTPTERYRQLSDTAASGNSEAKEVLGVVNSRIRTFAKTQKVSTEKAIDSVMKKEVVKKSAKSRIVVNTDDATNESRTEQAKKMKEALQLLVIKLEEAGSDDAENVKLVMTKLGAVLLRVTRENTPANQAFLQEKINEGGALLSKYEPAKP